MNRKQIEEKWEMRDRLNASELVVEPFTCLSYKDKSILEHAGFDV